MLCYCIHESLLTLMQYSILDARKSRLYSSIDPDLLTYVSKNDATQNHHNFCLTSEVRSSTIYVTIKLMTIIKLTNFIS